MRRLLLALVLCASIVTAQQKAYMVLPMVGGQPDIDTIKVNYVLCAEIRKDSVTRWGGYLFSGDSATLDKVAKRSVVEIVRVTEKAQVKWAELDAKPDAKKTTALNTYLTAQSMETVKGVNTNRDILNAVFKKMSVKFSVEANDVVMWEAPKPKGVPKEEPLEVVK